MTTVVFDTTSVSHFARAARLDALEAITCGHERLIPNEVAVELQRGMASYPALSDALSVPWVSIVELDFPEVIHAAAFKAELGGMPTEHLGECAVLAWVKQHGGIGIVDDSAAVAMARYHQVLALHRIASSIQLAESNLVSGVGRSDHVRRDQRSRFRRGQAP